MLAQLGAHHRHVARLVAHIVFLLEALLVLLVDDNQAEIAVGQEQRRARPGDRPRLATRHRAPDAPALCRAHRRMPLHRAAAETRGEAVEKLAGQRDFGQQDQHLFAPRQRRRDGLEINFRLARAGHAVEQAHREAASPHRRDELASGLGLLRREVGRGMIRIRDRRARRRHLDAHKRARLGQPLDHRRADPRDTCQIGLRAHLAVSRRSEDLLPRRRNFFWRRPGGAIAKARAFRLERARCAHHHLQDHAARASV